MCRQTCEDHRFCWIDLFFGNLFRSIKDHSIFSRVNFLNLPGFFPGKFFFEQKTRVKNTRVNSFEKSQHNFKLGCLSTIWQFQHDNFQFLKCGNTFWDSVIENFSPAARNLRTAKILTINNVMDAATPEHDSAQSHIHTINLHNSQKYTYRQAIHRPDRRRVGTRLQPWILYKSRSPSDHTSFSTINNSVKQL